MRPLLILALVLFAAQPAFAADNSHCLKIRDAATRLACFDDAAAQGSSQAVPLSGDAGRSCGAKTRCGQMTSCEEARFYLEQCGIRRLDGDGDGTPCESLC